jgi:hypothetical protein
MAPDWMDWDGWRWVSLVFTACIFFYFGWDARGTKERSRRWREELSRQVPTVHGEAPEGAVQPKDAAELQHLIARARSAGIDFSFGGKTGGPLWFWDEGMSDGE